MSSKKSKAEAFSASEEVALLTILQIQGLEGESAMFPSTKGQLSITSN